MKVISGTWANSDNTPVAGGRIFLTLSSPNRTLSGFTTNTQQVAASQVSFTLDNTGSLAAGTKIWFNDEITNPNTFYNIAVLAPGGGLVSKGKFTITGASFNFNNNAPS